MRDIPVHYVNDHAVMMREEDYEWLIERAQELEEENIGLKQDLKDVSDKLEAVSDV